MSAPSVGAVVLLLWSGPTTGFIIAGVAFIIGAVVLWLWTGTADDDKGALMFFGAIAAIGVLLLVVAWLVSFIK